MLVLETILSCLSYEIPMSGLTGKFLVITSSHHGYIEVTGCELSNRMV
jgi:hypothetical protein